MQIGSGLGISIEVKKRIGPPRAVDRRATLAAEAQSFVKSSGTFILLIDVDSQAGLPCSGMPDQGSPHPSTLVIRGDEEGPQRASLTGP